MYLYFEDWSRFLSILDHKNIPHGDKIIKVFASYEDPRKILGREDIAFVDVDHSQLREVFVYGERGTYAGRDIESRLSGMELSPRAIDISRALFRFANREDLRFCHEGMRIRKGDGWLIADPLGDIDGLVKAKGNPDLDGYIHLDIFVQDSLDRLFGIVFQGSEASVLPMMHAEVIRKRMKADIEGAGRLKEQR